MKFDELQVIKPIMRALVDLGYEEATPIQEESIPHVLNKKDLLATAETGTGKTAAFAIPMLQNIFNDNDNKKVIKGLVIAPTRELAQQIFESYDAYAKYINVKVGVIFGGVSQKRQERMLKTNRDIIIATPGRLIDLMNQKIINLDHVQTFVLDEADRLLDMGFVHDINRISEDIPKSAQTLLFSATMPKGVVDIANKLLVDPVKVATAPVSAPASTITQRLYYVDPDNKKKLLVDLLRSEFNDSVLVFTRTKNNAERLTRYLEKEGFTATALHGDKSQNQRSRALEGFKNYKFQVLVATDVAARGIDIDKLGCVVNYNIPDEAENYVHRIGRTGRAGAVGESIAFADYGERGLVQDVQKIMDFEIPVVDEHDYPMVDKSIQPPDRRSRRSRSGGRGKRGGSNHKRGRGNGGHKSSGGKPGGNKSGGSKSSGGKPARKPRKSHSRKPAN